MNSQYKQLSIIHYQLSTIMFSNTTFANPESLVLLIFVPLVAWWYLGRYKTHYAPLTISNLQALQGKSSWKGQWRKSLPIIRALAFSALIIAFARPQKLLKETDMTSEGIDIMLTMDLSSSMLSQDFTPDRLEETKRVASEFVLKREFDRIGLVIFSGEAYTQSPLTSDHKIILEFLANLKCGVLQDGTAIGMGLATAVNRIKDSPAKTKIIILMTDGVNNLGYIKPDVAAGIAKSYGIKVYTIGVGTQGEAMSPVGRRSDGKYIYQLVPVEIDEALLRDVANTTGGKYFRATNGQQLEQIYAEIDKLEKSKIDVTTIKRKSEEFGKWVLAAILLLILELAVRYTIFRTIP